MSIASLFEKEERMENKMLVQYLKKRSGQKRAVLVAMKTPEGQAVVGHALCRLALDEFDKHAGLNIALGRALAVAEDRQVKVPQSIEKEYLKFVERASKYFRGQVTIGQVKS